MLGQLRQDASHVKDATRKSYTKTVSECKTVSSEFLNSDVANDFEVSNMYLKDKRNQHESRIHAYMRVQRYTKSSRIVAGHYTEPQLQSCLFDAKCLVAIILRGSEASLEKNFPT